MWCLNRRVLIVTAGACAMSAQVSMASPLYQTDFSTDVSADWSLSSGASLTTGVGLDFSGGWGNIHGAELTGTAAINEADVIVTADVASIDTGNASAYAEVAARTSNTTDGALVRVYGAWENATVRLYDGAKMIKEDLAVSGLRSQHSDFTITLTVEGSTVSAVIYQAAGTNGSQSWNEVTHTISGTLTSTLSAGNVGVGGRAYTQGPLVTAVDVSLVPEPGSLALLATGSLLAMARRRR